MDKDTEQKKLLEQLNELEPSPASIVFMVLHKAGDDEEGTDCQALYIFDEEVLYSPTEHDTFDMLECIEDMDNMVVNNIRPAVAKAKDDAAIVLFHLSMRYKLVGIDTEDQEHGTAFYFEESEDGQTNIDAEVVQAIMDVIERLNDIDWHYELP